MAQLMAIVTDVILLFLPIREHQSGKHSVYHLKYSGKRDYEPMLMANVLEEDILGVWLGFAIPSSS